MRAYDQLLVASTFVIVGLVTFFVSLPLLYRKVPMNRFYGYSHRPVVRFRHALV
jgi:hypothetical protein